jgi:hypothetical protein
LIWSLGKVGDASDLTEIIAFSSGEMTAGGGLR